MCRLRLIRRNRGTDRGKEKKPRKKKGKTDPPLGQSTTLDSTGTGPTSEEASSGPLANSRSQDNSTHKFPVESYSNVNSWQWGRGGQGPGSPTTYGSTATAAEPEGMPLFFPARLWHNWCTAPLAMP